MAQRYNSCPNPALENNATGWIAYADNLISEGRVAVTGFGRPYCYQVAASDLYTEIFSARATASSGQTWSGSCSVRYSITDDVFVELAYFNAGGTLLSTTQTIVAVAANRVNRVGVSGVCPANTAQVAVRTYVYTTAGISYQLEMTMVLLEQVATVDFYFDGNSAGSLWDGAAGNSTSTFESNLVLLRRNRCPNPCFKYNITNWSAIGGATRTAVSGFARPFAYRKTGSTGSFAIYSARASAVPGEVWTSSLYIRSNVARTVAPDLDYYNGSGTYISGQDGGFLNLVAGVVTRLSLAGTTPANTAQIQMSIYWDATSTSDVMDVTMLMHEKVAALDSYFDGDTVDASWDGLDGNSTSTFIAALVIANPGAFLPFFE